MEGYEFEGLSIRISKHREDKVVGIWRSKIMKEYVYGGVSTRMEE